MPEQNKIPRGLGNNNPGNLRFNPDNTWDGQSTTQTDDSFVQFNSMHDGLRAMGRTIDTKRSRGDTSVAAILGTYAPTSENDTGSYINSVAGGMGIDPNEPVPVDRIPEMMAYMTNHENGGLGDLKQEDFINGYNAAARGQSKSDQKRALIADAKANKMADLSSQESIDASQAQINAKRMANILNPTGEPRRTSIDRPPQDPNAAGSDPLFFDNSIPSTIGNTLLSIGASVSNLLGGVVNSVIEATALIETDNVSAGDKATYVGLKSKQKQIAELEQQLPNASNFEAIKLNNEIRNINKSITTKEKAFQASDAMQNIAKVLEYADTENQVKDFFGGLDKYTNTKKQNRFFEDMGDKAEVAINKFDKASAAYEKGDYSSAAITAIDTIIGGIGDIAGGAIKNPLGVSKTFADSLPQIIGMSRSIATKALTAVAAGGRNSSENVAAWLKEGTGDSDLNTARAYSLAQTATELFGDYLLGGVGKRTGDSVIAAARKGATPVNAVVKGAKGAGGALLREGATEGVQESAESVLEQQAKNQDLDKTNVKEAVKSGFIGAAVGAGMAGPRAPADLLAPIIEDTQQRARDTASGFSDSTPAAQSATETKQQTGPADVVNTAITEGFDQADIASASTETLEELKAGAINIARTTTGHEVGGGLDKIGKAITTELRRRDAAIAQAVEDGTTPPTFGSEADNALDTAVKESNVEVVDDNLADTVLGKNKVDINEYSNDQLHDLHLEASTIATNADNKYSKSEVATAAKMITQVARKKEQRDAQEVKAAAKDIKHNETIAANASGIAAKIDTATSVEITDSAAAVLSNTAQVTSQEAETILDAQVDNIAANTKTFGSSTKAYQDAIKANRAVIAAGNALSLDTGTYNEQGLTNLLENNKASQARGTANKKAAADGLETGNVAKVQRALINLNDELNQKNYILSNKSKKEKNPRFVEFVKAEAAHVQANIDFISAAAKLNPVFKDINTNAATTAPSANQEAMTLKQDRIITDDASSLSLTTKGQQSALTFLAEKGILEEALEDTGDAKTLAGALASADLTTKERTYLNDVITNKGKLPKGTEFRTLVSKIDNVIKNDPEILGNNLADFIRISDKGAFGRIYSDTRLEDTRELTDVSQDVLNESVGSVHKIIADAEVDTIVNGNREDKIAYFKQIKSAIKQDEKGKTFTGVQLTTSATDAQLDTAIREAVDFINSNKIANSNSVTKSNPISPTPNYVATEGILGSSTTYMQEAFKTGKGMLANRVSQLLNTMSGNDRANELLLNGLNPEQKTAIRLLAEKVKTISEQGQSYYEKLASNPNKQKDDQRQKIIDIITNPNKYGDPSSLSGEMIFKTDGKKLTVNTNSDLFDIATLTAVVYGMTAGAGSKKEGLTASVVQSMGLIEGSSLVGTFGQSGVTQGMLVPVLGEHIYKSLGLKIEGDAGHHLKQQMESDLGELARQALISAGVIKVVPWAIKANANKTGVTSVKSNGKGEYRLNKKMVKQGEMTSKANGYRVYGMHSFDTTAMNDLKVSAPLITDHLSRIVSANTASTGIIPENREENSVNRTGSNFSQDHQESITIAEQHSLTPDFKKINTFLELSPEVQLAMLGYKSVEKSIGISKDAAESNITVMNEVIENLKIMRSNENEYSEIYQRTLVGRNLRLTQHSGMSPQANKLVRGMLAGQTETYNLEHIGSNGKTKASPKFTNLSGDTKTAVTEERAMKVTIARMFNEDKLGYNQTLKWFRKNFSKNSIGRRAAINASNLNSGAKLTDEQMTEILSVVKSGGMHAETFSGLIAAGDYFNAKDNGDTSVELNLFREDDGIANGIALSMLTYGINAKDSDELTDLLGRVGLTVEGKSDIFSRRDANQKDKQADIYQHFSVSVGEKFDGTGKATNDSGAPTAVDEETQNTVKGIKDTLFDMDELAKAMRDLVKEPLMRYIYGAGNAALLQNVQGQIATTLISRIQGMYDIADGSSESKRDVAAELKSINKALHDMAQLDKNTDENTLEIGNGKKSYVVVSYKKGEFSFNAHTPSRQNGKKTTPASDRELNTPAALSEAMGHGVDVLLGDSIIEVIESKFHATKATASVFNDGITILGEAYARAYNHLMDNYAPDGRITEDNYQAMMKELNDSFPGVASALSNAQGGTNGSITSAIKVTKTEPVKGENSFESISVNSILNKTHSTGKFNDAVDSQHVTGSPYSIHGLDASIVVRALKADNNIVQVYDGLIQSGLKQDATKAANQATHEFLTGDYNPIDAMVNSIESVTKNLDVILNNGKPTTLTVHMGGNVMKSTSYINSETGIKEHREYSYEEYLIKAKEVVAAMATYRAELKKVIKQVNQYGNIYGPESFPVDANTDVQATLVAAQEALELAVQTADKTTWGDIVVTGTTLIVPPTEHMHKDQRKKQLALRTNITDGTGSGVESAAYTAYSESLVTLMGTYSSAGNTVHLAQLIKLRNGIKSYEQYSLTNEEKNHALDTVEDQIDLIKNGNNVFTADGLVDFIKSERNKGGELSEASTTILSELEAITELDTGENIEFKESDANGNLKNTERGSTSPENRSFETQLQSASTDIRSKDATQIFDDLLTQNVNETPMEVGHTSYLRNMVKSLGSVYSNIGQTINVKVFNRLDAGGTEGFVTLSDAASQISINLRKGGANTALAQSAQEVFAHEYLHPLWHFALGDTSISAEATRLYTHVLSSKKLSHDLFLTQGVIPTAADITIAKDHFNHVFRNGEIGVEEFLTMAVSNQAFRDNLSSMLNTTPVAPKGFFARLGALFNKALGLINRAASRDPSVSKSVLGAVDELFVRSQSVLNSSASTGLVDSIGESIGDVNKALDNAGNKVLRTTASLFAPETVKSGASFADVTGSMADALRNVINDSDLHINDHVREISSQMFGDGVKLSEISRKISQGTTNIDVVAAGVKSSIMSQLGDLFKRELTEQENRDMTDVIGRTDLSSLFNYGVSESAVAHLLSDPTAVKQHINNVKAQLGNILSPMQVNAIAGHANATGHFMIHENQDQGTYLQNAYFIVQKVSNLHGVISKANRSRVEQMTDMLITLNALDKTNVNSRANVSALMSDTETSDGTIGALAMQNVVSKQATSHFNNQSHLLKKGHYSQVTNQNTDVAIAPLSETYSKNQEGYELVKTMGVPKGVIADSAVQMGIFVKPFGGNRTKSNSALVSSTNSKFGESVGEMLEINNKGLTAKAAISKDTGFIKQLDAAIDAESKIFAAGNRLPTSHKPAMIPVPTYDGKAREFRVHTIDTEFKDKHLGLSHDYVQSLATSASKISYKENAPIHNKVVTDYMIQTFKEDYSTRPNDFHVLDIKDPRIADQYNTIEPTAKAQLARAFGPDKVIVRKNQLWATFGYKIPSVMDMKHDAVAKNSPLNEIARQVNNMIVPFVSNKTVVAAEYYTREYVAELAKAIVVKTGAVTYANATSNLLLTGMYGMNPVQTVKDGALGLSAGMDFLNLRQEKARKTADLQLEQGRANPNQTKIGNLKATIGAIQNRMDKSPVEDMAANGWLSTVTLDHSVDRSTEFSARGRVRNFADKNIFNKVGGAGTVFKEAYALEDSQSYAALQMGTVMSDFAFKYAMHQHHMKNTNMTVKESYDKINYIFLAYETPSAKPVAYLESIGLLMFTKYSLRIQRVVADAFAEDPARVIRSYLLQEALMPGVANTFDGSYLGRAGISDLGNNPLNGVGTVLTPHPVVNTFMLAKGVFE